MSERSRPTAADLSALHVTSDGNAWAPLLRPSLDVVLVVANDEALQTTVLCILHAPHCLFIRMLLLTVTWQVFKHLVLD